LVKKFGTFTAVDRIDFEVRRGEIFALLGPNGAGKTTTFRMLCGMLVPSGGELTVAGANVRKAAASARARFGYVAQKFSLYGPLSVAENLDFFAGAYGLRGDRKRSRIAWAMEQFELGAHARTTSAQLPGGYKQRLAMAAALLHEPEILFLDEPTSGADPLARVLAGDYRLGRTGRDHHRHHALHAGGGILRSCRDHGRRPGAGAGLAGGSEGAGPNRCPSRTEHG
jgi:ABC-2 type transport system ATP-binding protein